MGGGHELKNALLSAHLNVVNLGDKREIDDTVWDLFQECYTYDGGLKTFYSIDEMVRDSLLWKIVYYGPLEDYSDFERDKVLAMAAYKSRAGLKRVASATNRSIMKDEFKRYVRDAYTKLVVDDFKKAWVEVSDKAESFLMRHGAKNYIIPVEKVRLAFPGRRIYHSRDRIHYTRKIGDKICTKIAIGTIQV